MNDSSYGLFEPNSGWPNTYLLILGLFAIANAATFTLDATLWQGRMDVIVYYHSLVKFFGGAAAFSVLKAALATEAWRLTMLWSERIRYKLRQQGREEGRQEGRHEGRQEGRHEGRHEGRQESREESRVWYERMQAAHERGEDFDEPPPWKKR